MNIILIICIAIIIFAILTYPKWSWKRWAKHCENNVEQWTGQHKGIKDCLNCGEYVCNPQVYHTSPPCTMWKKKIK
jgi:hypothetical protein